MQRSAQATMTVNRDSGLPSDPSFAVREACGAVCGRQRCASASGAIPKSSRNSSLRNCEDMIEFVTISE